MTRPIRLAVIFDQQIGSGGGYQQSLNAALLTQELPADIVDVVYFTTFKENKRALEDYDISALYLKIGIIKKLRICLRRYLKSPKFLRLIKLIERYNSFERILIDQKIDLVYFLSPCNWASDLEELNYITTVWDLCERDDPEFPEVRWNREFESREKNYRKILPRAIAVLVDSDRGKNSVVHRYGIDCERVHVMPFQPAPTMRANGPVSLKAAVANDQHALDVPYVFYPAQFWAHKNHVYLLEGLRQLEDIYKVKLGAIFSGGDKGNRQYVQDYAQSLGLADRVRFIGFVANEEMSIIYRNAVALVMPTYFGPTNLPPLEAFFLKVPVLYPDKAGLRDQVGNAALLMDLKDPGSMAMHLNNLVKDNQLRESLVNAGTARLAELDAICRASVLQSIVENFRWRRLCWK